MRGRSWADPGAAAVSREIRINFRVIRMKFDVWHGFRREILARASLPKAEIGIFFGIHGKYGF